VSLLVVIPFCAKDAHLAKLNLELAEYLDGKAPFDCLLTHDGTAADLFPAIEEQASAAFRKVHVFEYSPWKGEHGWPIEANYAWQQTAKFINRAPEGYSGWLWWEADATPLVPGWLSVIDQAYRKGKQLFAGHAMKTAAGTPYMNGVGVYPMAITAALANSPALFVRSQPFDVVAGPVVVKSFANLNGRIINFRKERGGAAGAHFNSAAWAQWRAEHKDAVLLHGCTDGSVARLLLGRDIPVTPQDRPDTGYLSVDLGDLIYNLPAAKALGITKLVLGPDNRSGWPDREPMTEKRAGVILPLLRAQPWITEAVFSATLPPNALDLNAYRHSMLTTDGADQDLQPGFNLVRVPLKHWGLPLHLDKEPWLIAPDPQRIAEVVISRSSRYHNPDFDWRGIVKHYGEVATFIGLAEEHRAFCQAFGTVPYHKTPTLLDVANVIEGADLFIGNQSAPFAIAVGLGKASLLEGCPQNNNCIFERGNIHINRFDVITAVAEEPPKPSGKSLALEAYCENVTGFGQLIHGIARGLASADVTFHVKPICVNDSAEPVLVERINPNVDRPDLLICAIELVTRLVPDEILLTMWEASRLPAAIVSAINSKARAMIVPSSWNASCFCAAGVDVPIRIVPLGIDTDMYHFIRREKDNLFRFGTAGRLSHGGTRKGVEDVIAWFGEAFPTERDVELRVKVFADCKLDPPTDKRVIVCREFLTTAQLVEWYRDLDCFASATKGEGWGLHLHQAMAIGRPVIAPIQGGQAEFMHPRNCLPVRWTYEKAASGPYVGGGQWCQPDKIHFIEQMRWAYNHPAACVKLGKTASGTVSDFTWDRTAHGVIKVLKEFGKL